MVVAILALLIAILLPSMQEARERARTVRCAANQRQLGVGLLNYVSDFGGYLPAYHGQNVGEVSTTREWFRFWKGYLSDVSFADTPTEERRQLWKLGQHLPAFDCPSTGEPTNYGYQGTHPKTFDYRMSAHWATYSSTQPASGVGEPFELYHHLPNDGIWLIDSASKLYNEGNSHEPMTGQDHPSYALFPAPGAGGVYSSWFFTNTSTVPSNADWPFVWHSPMLGNYSGNNFFSPGIHHRDGANILTPDGAAGWFPIATYLPEFENPINWRSIGRLAPSRLVWRH